MVTGSYDLDTVEETFDVTLKIDLTFTRLSMPRPVVLSEGFEHYDYQCLSKSRHVSIVPSDDIDDSKVIEDVHVLSQTTCIIEDISVIFDTDS